MAAQNKLQAIFEKTRGCCHFCGDPLDFAKYDLRVENEIGSWNIDHVVQKDKGGSKDLENCLPACVECNRLRWNRTGANLREALFLGIISIKEMERGSELGKLIGELKAKRLAENRKRRKLSEGIPVEEVEGWLKSNKGLQRTRR